MNGALAGQVAIVAGASRGIGEAIARRFAHEGAHVAAVARTLEPSDSRPGSLRQTVDAITAAGAKAFAVQADLSVAGDRARLIAEVEERAGAADILVNNAAVTWLTPIAEFGQKRYDLMFELQVKAPVALRPESSRPGGPFTTTSSRTTSRTKSSIPPSLRRLRWPCARLIPKYAPVSAPSAARSSSVTCL